MGAIDYSKLAIQPDPDMAEWWEATKERRFLIRCCNQCGQRWFPPFPACLKCSSLNIGWVETTGKGVVYSYNVVTQPILAQFIPAVPYAVAIVTLADGQNADGSPTRIGGAVVDNPDGVAIGLPCELAWDDHPTQPFKIPRIKLSAPAAPGMWKFGG